MNRIDTIESINSEISRIKSLLVCEFGYFKLSTGDKDRSQLDAVINTLDKAISGMNKMR